MQRNQSSSGSVFDNLQSLGALSTVFVDSIARQKNLDYLEYLCSYCQSMPLNYIWHAKQSAQNKRKMLLVYQLAISYSAHLQKDYKQQKIKLQRQLDHKKKEVVAKRAAVRQHKAHVSYLKDKAKFIKLNKIKGVYAHQLHKIKEMHQLYEQEKKKNIEMQRNFDPIAYQQWQMQQIHQMHYPQYQKPVYYAPGYEQNHQMSHSPSQQFQNRRINSPPNLYLNQNQNQYISQPQSRISDQTNQSNMLGTNQILNEVRDRDIQRSVIIAKNDQIINRNQSSVGTLDLKEQSRMTPKSSGTIKNGKSESFSQSQRDDTIGQLCVDSNKPTIRQSRKFSSITGKDSDIYNQNIDSMNNLQLLPQSKHLSNSKDLKEIKEMADSQSMSLSKNSDVFKSKRIQISDDPSQNSDLLNSNVGSKTESRQIFGGKFISRLQSSKIEKPQKQEKPVINLVDSTDNYNIYSSNRGHEIEKPHIKQNISNQKQGSGKYNNNDYTPAQSVDKKHTSQLNKAQNSKDSVMDSGIMDSGIYDFRNSNQGEKSNSNLVEKFITQSKKNLVISVLPPKIGQNDQLSKQQDYLDDFDQIPEKSYLGQPEKRDTSIQKSKVDINISDDQNNRSRCPQLSQFISLPTKQLVPLKKLKTNSVESLSVIGSLKEHSFVLKPGNIAKDQYRNSQSYNDDFLNDFIDIPMESVIARPSKLNMSTREKQVKSKVLPPTVKRNNMSQSVETQYKNKEHNLRNQTNKQDSNESKQNQKLKFSNTQKQYKQKSRNVPLEQSLQLKQNSYKSGSQSDMLSIKGSQMREKQINFEQNQQRKQSPFKPKNFTKQRKSSHDNFKDPSLKVDIDLVNSHTIDEKLLTKHKLKQISIKGGNQKRKRQQVNDGDQILQEFQLNDSSSVEQQKQELQMKLLALIRQNPSSFKIQSKQKVQKRNWVQQQIKKNYKKQQEDWLKIQKEYQRKTKAMKAELQRKRQENKNISQQRLIRKINFVARKPSVDDDLSYSKSMIQPPSVQLISGITKKEDSKKILKLQSKPSDIQKAIITDSRKNSDASISETPQDSEIPQKLKQKQVKEDKKVLRSQDSKQKEQLKQQNQQKPQKILQKMQQGHKYDVQNPIDTAIRQNKDMFRNQLNKVIEDDEFDW